MYIGSISLQGEGQGRNKIESLNNPKIDKTAKLQLKTCSNGIKMQAKPASTLKLNDSPQIIEKIYVISVFKKA